MGISLTQIINNLSEISALSIDELVGVFLEETVPIEVKVVAVHILQAKMNQLLMREQKPMKERRTSDEFKYRYDLTRTDIEAICLLILHENESYPKIASRYGINRYTFKKRISNILERVRARNKINGIFTRHHLTAIAKEANLPCQTLRGNKNGPKG